MTEVTRKYVSYESKLEWIDSEADSEADPGRGPPLPIFGPNWGPKGRKKFF